MLAQDSDARPDFRPSPGARRSRGFALTGVLTAVALSVGLGASAASLAEDVSEGPSVVESTAGEPMGTRVTRKRLLPYPMQQVWPTAIRYLRVDRGYGIVDRDPETGYVVFAFEASPKVESEGSLEVFETTDSAGRPSVTVQISTELGPAHLPHTLIEGLAKKIREERGQPPPPPKKSPAPTKPKGDDEPDDHAPPQVPPALDPSDLVVN